MDEGDDSEVDWDATKKLDGEDPVARGIALGSLMLGAYFLNELLAEESAETTEDGKTVIRKKGFIEDLMSDAP